MARDPREAIEALLGSEDVEFWLYPYAYVGLNEVFANPSMHIVMAFTRSRIVTACKTLFSPRIEEVSLADVRKVKIEERGLGYDVRVVLDVGQVSIAVQSRDWAKRIKKYMTLALEGEPADSSRIEELPDGSGS